MNFNQGGAGGFQNDNYGGSGGGGGGGGALTKMYLPITLKQAIEAHNTAGEDVYYVDGVTPSKVTFIAKIKSVQESSTNITFKMEDGTGMMEVQLWVANNETDSEAQQRAAWREDTYVRVVGHINEFMEKRRIRAAHIAVVDDFNEITFHMLEVVQCHLKNTNVKPEQNGHQAVNSTTGYAMPNYNSANNAPIHNSSYGGMAGVSGPASTGYGGEDLETPVQREVLNAIKSTGDTTIGVHIDALCTQLPKYSAAAIKETIDYLSNEGHIYSTINEDHFLSTDSG
eukprot:CFRG0999T1